MKIRQICEAGDPKAIALMTARRVLTSIKNVIQDFNDRPMVHGKRITGEAILKGFTSYLPDLDKALRAIEAVREGRETKEDIKLILEFEESEAGKAITKLMESK